MLAEEEFLDVVCVGAPRSGTTWLATALDEHPEVWVPPEKELNYFNERFLNHRHLNYRRGIEYYRSQFEGAPRDALLADLTPTYFADPNAAFRIWSHFPNARILALLRNPAEVVFSTYLQVRQFMSLPDSLEEALRSEPDFLYLGHYYRNLLPYYDWFGPDRVLVAIYEDFFEDPVESVAEVYDFLDVDASFRPDVGSERVNPRRAVRSRALVRLNTVLGRLLSTSLLRSLRQWLGGEDTLRKWQRRLLKDFNLSDESLPELDPDTRALLTMYRPEVRRLEELIGKSLEVWDGGLEHADQPARAAGPSSPSG